MGPGWPRIPPVAYLSILVDTCPYLSIPVETPIVWADKGNIYGGGAAAARIRPGISKKLVFFKGFPVRDLENRDRMKKSVLGHWFSSILDDRRPSYDPICFQLILGLFFQLFWYSSCVRPCGGFFFSFLSIPCVRPCRVFFFFRKSRFCWSKSRFCSSKKSFFHQKTTKTRVFDN